MLKYMGLLNARESKARGNKRLEHENFCDYQIMSIIV
jgi:hypothetical protein